jgi:hypothetical protein
MTQSTEALDRTAAAEQVQDQRDHCKHQEQVNCASDHVECRPCQDPRNQQEEEKKQKQEVSNGSHQLLRLHFTAHCFGLTVSFLRMRECFAGMFESKVRFLGGAEVVLFAVLGRCNAVSVGRKFMKFGGSGM